MRAAGESHGITDGAAPQNATPYQLSRVLDVIDEFEQLGLDVATWWKTIPESIRFDFNWSKWQYETRVPGRNCTIH
jgi:hypothetical protein